MPTPRFPCEGGCVCGAVRYRLLEDPLELHVCHCTDCQRVSGTAFVMTMGIQGHTVELLEGDTVLHDYRTPEGIRRPDRACCACGTRVWSESTRIPGIFALRPGTLDDTSWLDPIAHIWTASAQPWVAIPDDVLRYEHEPDSLALVRAWKQRSQA